MGDNSVETPRKKSALIIAGAAARGPFAAGALSVIAEYKSRFDVRCVVGTSSGALNAAVYAAGLRVGRPECAAQLLDDLWRNQATWWRIATQAQRIRIVAEALRHFRRLPTTLCDVQLRIVATSLDGKLEHSDGRPWTTFERTYEYSATDFTSDTRIEEISRAAIASAAIPGVFWPVSIDRSTYVDGGVVDNAPIAWAIDTNSEIDDLLVVTPDPPTTPKVGGNPLSWPPRLLDIVIGERLSRDLHTARSFNKELEKLQTLGVSSQVLRKELQWRILNIVEIRPPEGSTPGGLLGGFFSASQRAAAIALGSEWAKCALARQGTDALARPAGPSMGRVSGAAAPQTLPAATSKCPVSGTAATAATPAKNGSPATGRTDAPRVSKHLRGRAELLLIAPIKQDLVAFMTTLTYATRLRMLLSAFFGLRQAGVERSPKEYVGPLESVNSLHFIQWAILNEGRSLLLAVTFDGPWESYIRSIVDNAGPFLDVIFCHCENYEGHATKDGYESFASWVRRYQVESAFFHAAAPDVTADDIRYLKLFESTQATVPPNGFPERAATLHVSRPAGDADPTTYAQVVGVFSSLRVFFPTGSGAAGVRSDQELFDTMARTELRLLNPNAPEPLLGMVSLEALLWYRTLMTAPPVSPPPAPVTIGNLDSIQGNILSGYDGMRRGALVFLQFESAAAGAGWLRSVSVTTQTQMSTGTTYNIGLTFPGLKTLGLDPSVLSDFPEEFQEGMEARAAMLGDVGRNHPQNWKGPAANWPPQAQGASGQGPPLSPVVLSTIDAVVVLQASALPGSEAELQAWIVEEITQKIQPTGVRVLGFQPLARHATGDEVSNSNGMFREHFGFLDGFSQPVPRAYGFLEDGPVSDQVALGELLLGYPNERGEISTYGDPALSKNGSFLAIRKIRQDVAAFDRFIGENERKLGMTPGEIKAKVLGREIDGKPLSGGPATDNGFNFSDDADGKTCPLFAHIRRANPRGPAPAGLTPRIMRRGFSYGPRYAVEPDVTERGLVFMAYVGSLGNQFEIVQSWLNGGNSTGMPSSHGDPLIGQAVADAPQLSFFRDTGAGVTELKRLTPAASPLVSLEWGLYLFVPSVTGIHRMADLASAPIASQVQRGRAICESLDALQGATAQTAWKAVLEDPDRVSDAADVWAAIRADGGFKTTPFGALVGDAEGVVGVLSNYETYSVCEYDNRMKASVGPLYLGFDPGAPYARASALPNRFAASISRKEAFDRSLRTARAVLANVSPMDPPSGGPKRTGIDVPWLTAQVIGLLSKGWFGLPDGMTPDETKYMAIGATPVDEHPCCPGDFEIAAAYIFQPWPGAPVESMARDRGRLIWNAATSYVEDYKRAYKASGSAGPNQLLNEILKDPDGPDPVQSLIGLMNGFVSPTTVTFINVMSHWIEGGDLWRVRQWVQDCLPVETCGDKICADGGHVFRAMVGAMARNPVPNLLPRTRAKKTDVCPHGAKDALSTPIDSAADTRVVVSLASAAADGAPAESVLFGGAGPGQRQPVHSCPGKEMALGVLLGLITAIAEKPDLRREGPLLLSFAS
jgi:Dyp-type peroxidase family